MYTNQRIRNLVLPLVTRGLERQGILQPRVANPVDVIQRTARTSQLSGARIKQIQEQNESITAERDSLRKEVEELKRRLAKLGVVDEALYTSGRLPW